MSDVTAWVGHRIQSLRLEWGWTQEQLAEYADLHVSYISTLEKEKKNPSIEVISRLSSAFQLTLSEFFSAAPSVRRDIRKRVEQEEVETLLKDFSNKLLSICNPPSALAGWCKTRLASHGKHETFFLMRAAQTCGTHCFFTASLIFCLPFQQALALWHPTDPAVRQCVKLFAAAPLKYIGAAAQTHVDDPVPFASPFSFALKFPSPPRCTVSVFNAPFGGMCRPHPYCFIFSCVLPAFSLLLFFQKSKILLFVQLTNFFLCFI